MNWIVVILDNSKSHDRKAVNARRLLISIPSGILLVHVRMYYYHYLSLANRLFQFKLVSLEKNTYEVQKKKVSRKKKLQAL